MRAFLAVVIMSPAFAIVIAAFLILAWLGLYSVLTRQPRGRHAAPFADPDEGADPYGEQYIRALRAAEDFPFPVACDGYLGPLPPDPPPAETAELPVVQCELGGQTVSEWLDEVFARHADGTVMLP